MTSANSNAGVGSCSVAAACVFALEHVDYLAESMRDPTEDVALRACHQGSNALDRSRMAETRRARHESGSARIIEGRGAHRSQELAVA